MTAFGTRMSVSGAMVQGAADTMRGALTGVMDPLMKVQDAAAPLQTVISSTMGGVEKSMKAATDAAVDWSKQHVQAGDEFLKTTYMMASAGLNDVQSIEGTKTALALATATMGDNKESASLLATVYNNMGDKAKDVGGEMTRLGDVLAKSQQYFQYANLGVLTESLKYAMPAAIQARMGIEQLNVVVGQLNNAGLSGSMAGTAFTASMIQMTKASQDLGFAVAKTKDGGVDFIGTLDNITKKYGDLSRASPEVQMAFQKAFGTEGLRAITLLQNKTGDMKKALDGVTNSTGAAAEAQKTMEATATAQMQVLKNEINDVKMDLAKELVPILQGMIPQIKQIVTEFAGWARGHPELVKTGALLAMIMTGVLMILAPLLTVGGAFISIGGYALDGFAKAGKAIMWFKGLLTSPALINSVKMLFLNIRIGAAMTGQALASAGRYVGSMAVSLGRATLSAIRFAAVAAGQAATAAGRMALSLLAMGKQAIFTAITALPGLIASTWAFTAALLANPVTWIVIGIMALIVAIILLARNWDKVTAAFSIGWNWIKQMFQEGKLFVMGIFQAIGQFFAQYGLIILAVIAPFIGIPLLIIKNWSTISTFFAQLWSSVIDIIHNALNGAVDWIMGLGATFEKSGSALWDAFTNGIKKVVSKPVEAVKEGLQKIRNMLPFSDAKTGPLSQLTKSGQKLITTFQDGAEAKMGGLQKALATGLAGMALMAPLPQLPESLPPLTGVAQYEMASSPVASVPKSTDILKVDTPDLSDFFPSSPGGKNGGSSGPKPVVVQGDVHLHIDKVDSPDDLWEALRRFAEEVDG